MSAGAFGWAIYRGAGRLAAPLAAAHLARRADKGKEDPGRLDEKRGIASARTPERPVWLHAVSVGESVAALALARALIDRGFAVLMTTGTPTAARRVATSGVPVVHQYAPLDAPPFIERFLDTHEPIAALFTESEIWPATIYALARRRIPRAHVNAHMSERSFRRWLAKPWLSRPLFSLIPLALTQTAEDADHWRALGVPRAVPVGNLKFDAAPPVADPAAIATLRAAIGARPVWLAASIHPGEEEAVIEAHHRIRAAQPDVLTLVAPRHPETAERVMEAAARGGDTPLRRSSGAPLAGDLYVVDTVGEMGTFFSLAPVVFLGGSLVPVGGHNPAEPAAFGAALLTGPSHGTMFAPFLESGAATLTADGASLGDAVAALLADEAARATASARALATLEAERGAVARTLDGLGEVLARAREFA